MSSINFDNVYLLLIAIPLIVLFTVPFCIAVRKDNRNGHNIASQIMHVVMAIIIAFAAAGTSMTTVLTETDIYVVADVSYSANKNLDNVDGYIKQLNLPRNSKVGLVCFGKDYRLVSELGRQKDLASVRNSGVDDSETNIAEALNYTGTLFKEDVIKRIVLITDGRQTDQVDTYAVRRAVDTLQTMDIKVDAIFLDDNIDEGTREVQISDAEFTRSAYIRHEEKVNFTVQSTYDTDNAIFTLLKKEGDEYVQVQQMSDSLVKGRNLKSFKLDTSEGGVFEYMVQVEADGDTSSHNNTYSFTQKVSTDISLLILSGDWESAKALIERYEDVASIELYENTAADRYEKERFKAAYDGNPDPNPKINIHLSEGQQSQIPITVNELCVYDEIIIDSANLSGLNGSGMEEWIGAPSFISSLELVVKAGKSLVTIGNVHIPDAGQTETNTGTVSKLQTLDNMLPIKFGKDDQLPNLYAIVLDVSTSLRDGNRFVRAKDIAQRFLDKLSENDDFCIFTFNGLVSVLQTPTSVKSGRDNAKKALQNVEMGTGTVIGRGLEQAYDIIDKQKSYSGKQFFLITDGVGDLTLNSEGYDWTGNTETGIYKFVGDLYNEGIVTSVADMGRSTQGTFPGDKVDLNVLAQKGRGKYTRFSGNGETADDDLFADMADSQLPYTLTGERKVEIVNKTDDVLKGLSRTSAPNVSGFALGYAKPSAITVMNVVYTREGSISEKKSPLYAYWKYGNGTVASFASAAAGDWIEPWSSAGVKDIFLDNIFDTVIPDEKEDYPFSIDINREESSTSVQVALDERPPDASAVEMRIKIVKPDGETVEHNFNDSGYDYNYEFLTSEVGRYDLTITYDYKNVHKSTDLSINVSYPSEYNEFAAFEASSLFKAINGRGTVSTDGSLTIENDPSEVGVYNVDFTIPLLIICVVLYIIDIVVRKLKWEDVVSFFGGFKKQDNINKSGGEKR